MKKTICAVLIAVSTLMIVLAASSSISTATPPVCPPTLVCFTIEEAHKINVKLIRLDEEIKKLKARKRKALGFAVGCGPVVSIESDLDLACGLTWGWRFH